MVVAVASWSLEVEPGKRFSLVAERDFRITNACFGKDLADEKGRSVIEVQIDEPLDNSDEEDEEDELDEERPETITTVLCSLRAGLCEQSSLDVTFLEGQQLEFSVSGKNKVYLLGNYIDQDSYDRPPFGGDSDFDSDEEDGYPLGDLGSDVEMGADGLAGLDDDGSDEGRFEEVPETKSDSKKRPRPSDSADGEAKLPKNQQKKLNKKLKAADGSAVPVGQQEETSKSKGAEKEKTKSKPDAEKPKNDKSKSKADGDKPKGKAGDEKPKSKAASEAKTLAGGLIIQDVKLGTGPGAKKGQKLSMRYIGKLTNGKVFDKNTGGSPFAFKLGKGQVIKGWDDGLVGMQPGGERLLTIPGHLAYGSSPPPGIPKNATLIFEVKLISAV
ncbi:hypothetical protein BKA62DRAFT_649487 [Auriculariales sp. MPI-PUGE-AT-0066]|nr:hypothetical protein BKA62DRAFT_649487 [Auriculariales sp. MPI-PUGE-AT-0066]